MEPVQFLLILFAVAIAVPLMVWHWKRSRKLVENWAKENAYAVVEIERRFLRAGPFSWRRSRGHEVFHVVVRDARGQRRTAFVRTGGWFLGQCSDQVTVEWDDGPL